MDKKTYDYYTEILREHLSEYRLHHSFEVAKAAKRLSEKYGGDPEKMYTAGLLHDVLKEAERDEIFYYADKYSLNLTELEKNTKKLWHSIVGAEYIRHEIGIDDEEIITSVKYHTTGRAGMSLSEKILFIADFISADRIYDGVEIMREKAERSLEEAMLEGLSFTVKELVENSKAVHPATIDAYNDIVMNYREKGLI